MPPAFADAFEDAARLRLDGRAAALRLDGARSPPRTPRSRGSRRPTTTACAAPGCSSSAPAPRSSTRTGSRLATGAEYSREAPPRSPPAAAPCVPDIPGAELGITSNEMFDLEAQPEAAADRRRRLHRLRVRRHHERPRHPGDPALPRRPDPARLRRRPARPRRRRHARARHRARDRARGRRGSSGPAAASGSALDNGETPRRRPGAVRHRPQPQHRRPRARGARRRPRAPNGAVAVDDWSQTAVPSIYAVGDVTDRHRADPGRDPRGPGLRRDGLRRPADAGRPPR